MYHFSTNDRGGVPFWQSPEPGRGDGLGDGVGGSPESHFQRLALRCFGDSSGKLRPMGLIPGGTGGVADQRVLHTGLLQVPEGWRVAGETATRVVFFWHRIGLYLQRCV